MILQRRQFLRCLTGIVAAPAIVKADALMKVFAPKNPSITISEILRRRAEWELEFNNRWIAMLQQRYEDRILYGDPNASPYAFTGLAPLLTAAEHSA